MSKGIFCLLMVPKAHIHSAAEINAHNEPLAGRIFTVIANCGPDARQSVPRLPFHILGGKPMAEKMA